MSTPEDTGVSRREMLRRSAVVGGTLLWVTPTVSVLSASPALAGSPTPRGDGSPLDASYYLLSFQCGEHFYLAKVGTPKPSKRGHTPFEVTWGRDVHGADWDIYDGSPASETGGIAQKHLFALPGVEAPGVAFYVIDGMLFVDLDADNDGHPCVLDYWTAHKGQSLFKPRTPSGPFDWQVADDDDPTVIYFPLLVKEQADHIRRK
jgi:hypothetical protein